jgi:hypothetical protein
LVEIITSAPQVKPKVPNYIRDIVRANFTLEMEFYEFCKQRLLRQYFSIL